MNTGNRDFVAEIYEEDSSVHDVAEPELTGSEKKAPRVINQSGTESQRIDYIYTMFDKETGKRQVMKINMPYDHVKIASTDTS